jgi:lipoprotein-releasing system permease protein
MNKKILAIKTVIFSYFKKSKNDFRFTMISVGIAIWGLLVISSIINGFDNVLIKSITDFYPHIIISGEHNLEQKEIDFTYNISFDKALLLEPELKIINIIKTNSLEQFSKKFVNKTSSNDKYIIGNDLKNFLYEEKLRVFKFNNYLPSLDTIEVDNVFKTNINTFDQNFILSKVQNNEKFNYTAIVLKNPQKAKEFKEKYLSGLSSLTWKESNQTLTQTIEIDSLISLLITFFIVLMASFSVTNSLTFSFLKRKREIGLLKITGFSNRNIKSIFLFESLLTSIIGYFSGLILSLLTVFILNIIKIPLPKGIFYIEYLPIDFDVSMMFISFFVSILIVSMISLVNLKRLMKFDHIEVLKDGE